MMQLDVFPQELPLVRPFRVAGFTLTAANTVVTKLTWNEHTGYGEAAPLDRYGDSVESIAAFFEGYSLPAGSGPFSHERVLAGVPRAARCALDIAMYDVQGKVLGASITELLGLEGLSRPITSLTVPIEDDRNIVLERVRALRDSPAIKVKVGATGADDIALIEAIRVNYTGAIRIDANEGWDAEGAVRMLRELERFEIELCEQPIPAGHPEQLRYISERSPIPLMADEDALEAADLGPLIGCVDAINVKLAKCGGIGPALTMIRAARALGFRTMIGCMAESSILATAAAHLGPLVDWLDIDGPTFLAHDPFSGLRFERGTIVMPDGAGLGVRAA